MIAPYWIEDADMAALQDSLPGYRRRDSLVSVRARLSGVVTALRQNIAFRAVPEDVFGPSAQVSTVFARWSRLGVMDDVFSRLIGPDGRLAVTAPMIWRHRTAARFAEAGFFPSVAPLEERIAA